MLYLAAYSGPVPPNAPDQVSLIVLVGFCAVLSVAALAIAFVASRNSIHNGLRQWRPLIITAVVSTAVMAAVGLGAGYRHGRDVAEYEAWPRVAVAANPSTSGTTLAGLAEAGRHDIRLAVAGNPSTPADALTVLAVDASTEIRAAVAANPSTPAATLHALAADPDATVGAAATRRLP